MATVLEYAKLLGYALVATVIFVFVRLFPGFNNSKATGLAVVRAVGYEVMFVGFFTIVLGFVLTSINLIVGADGRPHFTLR
jgi:hypothetical protein